MSAPDGTESDTHTQPDAGTGTGSGNGAATSSGAGSAAVGDRGRQGSEPGPPGPDPVASAAAGGPADEVVPVAIDKVAAFVEEYDLKQAVGGLRGVVDSGLASTAFVAVYALAGHHLGPSLWAAVAVTLALVVVRAVRREPLRQALTGVLAVGVSALIALLTGRAANFFVVGIVVQVLYAAAYLVSLAAGWPLMGVIVGPLVGEGMAWRADPPRRRAYWWCSWIWFAVFVFRTAVQVPLYLQDKVVTLGIVKIAMGWPLFALAGLASWLILRRVPVTVAVTRQPAAEAPAGE